MKYTKKERLDIGKRVYDGEFNKYQVATEYDISEQTARNYMRQYRFANGLPAKEPGARIQRDERAPKPVVEDPGLEKYEAMTREELIQELVRDNLFRYTLQPLENRATIFFRKNVIILLSKPLSGGPDTLIHKGTQVSGHYSHSIGLNAFCLVFVYPGLAS